MKMTKHNRINDTEQNIWYAVQSDDYDAWDYGSTDKDEAIAMAIKEAKTHSGVKIVIIDDDDNFALDEIEI